MLNARNRDYWKNRAEELEARAHAISTEALMELEPQFDRAAREIQLEIERWYARLAKNNNVSPAEAMGLLSASELKEFRWTVEEYIKFAEKNELSGAWVKELENASAKFHITRLEALKLKVQHQVEKAFGNELDTVDGMISKVYTDGYYRNCFELSKGFGLGFDIAAIDERKLEILKRKPWAPDGQNFSSRIWTNKREMVGTLQQELTRQALLGSSLDEAIATMSKFVDKKFRVAKTRAAALVRTEQAAFASAAQKDAYKELGLERYQIVATLDSHTSDICRDMDGEHFPVKDLIPGVSAPPFHVRCRTTTCPYFNDEFTVGEKRAARDKDGNLYYVPADMTYREWEKEFVKSNKPFYDSTKRWTSASNKKSGIVENLKRIEVDGTQYAVDGRHVVLDYSKEEKTVADLIASKYGRDVKMVPRINFPLGLSTPDYLIDGRKYDLKTISGSGKSVIFDAVKKKIKQADNFIIDISNSKLSLMDADEQIKKLYYSKHTEIVDEVLLIENGQIVKVYRRK